MIVRHRFPVFRTTGKEDTVALLLHLEASAARGRLDPYTGGAAHAEAIVHKKKVLGHEDAGVNMLACVSGVSASAARAILDVHGDVPALIKALQDTGERSVSSIMLGKKRLGKVGDKLMTAFNLRAHQGASAPSSGAGAESDPPPANGGDSAAP